MCTRCGLRRQVNAGRKRKLMGTGLCKSCFDSTDWTCMVCNNTFSLNYKSLHLRACTPS